MVTLTHSAVTLRVITADDPTKCFETPLNTLPTLAHTNRGMLIRFPRSFCSSFLPFQKGESLFHK